tara:strand:+ start:4830 stop:5876 length:1047 start_codon:yes stop_codon:yes gene_type:complete
MAKRILQALRRETVDRPPYWLMRQAGRYLPEYRKVRATTNNFLEFCYTPEKAVEATLQPLRRYNTDAAILFSDILVIPDALGQKVRFEKGKGPVLEALIDDSGIDNLSIDHVEKTLEPVFETVKQISTHLNSETSLIGFAGSPWTVALYMIEGRSGTEGTLIRTWSARQPGRLQRLINLLVEATILYLDKQVQAGAEVLQLFDSWAGLLDEQGFRTWIIEPNKWIIRELKTRYPHIPIIGFPRNAGIMTKEFVIETGVDGVSIDHTIPTRWAADNLQPLCAVQGNLDNHLLLAGGFAMEKAALNILENLGQGPFIFNLGHGVLPSTPPENVAQLCEIICSWRNRSAKL